MSPKNDLLAVGANSHTIGIYNLSTGLLVHRINAHTHNIPHLSFSHCGRFVISASIDCSCKVTEAISGKVICANGLSKSTAMHDEDENEEGQWAWSALIIDLSSIETDLPAHRTISRGLRERREFWNGASPDASLSSCEDEYYQHYSFYSEDDYENSSDTENHEDEMVLGMPDLDEEAELAEWRQDVHDLFNVLDAAMVEATTEGITPIIIGFGRTPSIEDTYPRRPFDSPAGSLPHFHRLQNLPEGLGSPGELPAVFEIGFPKSPMISLAMSDSDLFLFGFDPKVRSPNPQILHIDAVLARAFNEANMRVNNRLPDRFIFLFWLPEFSTLLAGNQIGRLVLIHFTRVSSRSSTIEDEDDLLRLSVIGFPCPDLESRTLNGMDVRRVESRGGLYYEVFCFHAAGVVRLFRIRRSCELEPILSFENL